MSPLRGTTACFRFHAAVILGGGLLMCSRKNDPSIAAGSLPEHHVPVAVWLLAAVVYLACIAVTAWLAAVFVSRDALRWNEMNGLLLLGTVALAIAVMVHATCTSSFSKAVTFFAIAFATGLAAEVIGVESGRLFGSPYAYHEEFVPKLVSGVPLFVPLAWFVLAYSPLVFLRRIEIGSAGRPRLRKLLGKALLCACGLVAADLFLDPLATSVRAWTWQSPGGYFGVPVGNYAGWWLVGMVIYTTYFGLISCEDDSLGPRVFAWDGSFVATSIFFTAAALVAVTKHRGSILPAVLGSCATAPYLVYWWRSWKRPAKLVNRDESR